MALTAFDKLPAAPSAALLEETSQQLSVGTGGCISSIRFHIVILQESAEPETRIYMTEEQIRKNDEVAR